MKKKAQEGLIIPEGVEVRGSSVRIAFRYEGVTCKETIRDIRKIDNKSLRYAANKRESILIEIHENRFDYRAHFPNSKKALQFSGASANDINRTVSQGVDMWLEIKAELCADETMVGYKKKSQHVKDYFQSRRMRTIKTNDVIRFREHLRVVVGLGTKTINDVFTPLRQAFLQAKRDQIITSNPLELIPNIKPSDESSDSSADPYTAKEMARIEKLNLEGYYRPQIIKMFLFTCWTGLRLSEALAIAWEDVDQDTWRVKIRRAMVSNKFKSPKEKASIREFELLQPAIDILIEMRAYTYMQRAIEIERKAFNNVDVIREKIRPIFRNERPECEDGLLRKRSLSEAYATLLRMARVRHRGANQCRHTFASMLITRHVPLSFIFPVMGHRNEEMLRKVYGKIIPEDRPNVARIISGIAGFDYKPECLTVLKEA